MRYWGIGELKRTFNQLIGPSCVTVDCYFGLGLQKADAEMMHRGMRALIGTPSSYGALASRSRCSSTSPTASTSIPSAPNPDRSRPLIFLEHLQLELRVM